MATACFRVLWMVCGLFSFARFVFVNSHRHDVYVSVCCDIGIAIFNNYNECKDPFTPRRLNSDSAPEVLCSKITQLCCDKLLRKIQCEKGVQTYKTTKTCKGGGFEGKCCSACAIGERLREMNTECAALDIPVADELKKPLVNCCLEGRPTNVTDDGSVKPEDDQSTVNQRNGEDQDYDDDYDIASPVSVNFCDLLPGQLCSQVCVPTNGSYYCKCQDGYVLMEDQKTCKKDTFHATKVKPTVAPRVIVPNPEKPVPLHKPKENLGTRDFSTTNSTMVSASTPATAEPAIIPATAPASSSSESKKTCKDFNSCEQECIDLDSGYKCTCLKGFEIDSDEHSCNDVDECLNGTHDCDVQTEECVNDIGGFSCIKPENSDKTPSTVPPTAANQSTTALAVVPKEVATGACPAGFEEVNGNCTDVDECDHDKYPEACGRHYDCINTPGSFLCRCKTGFQENPATHQCEDINECQTNLHNCLASQRCDNSIGSYQCVRFTGCGTGYTLNLQNGQCEDDDECLLGTDNCRFLGPNYVCRNTLGSFRCERKRCLPGDSTCDSEKHCPSGYIQSESGNCVDVDECNTGTHNCHPFADVCINRVGGFECKKVIHCPKGYDATANGCMDINECTTKTHMCKGLAECKNEKGTYSCVCPPGYQLAPDNSCEDINECSFYLCPYNSKCINTPGSYMCNCNVGFRNINENSCQDIDECSVTPGICQHTCINVFGSFRCTCKTGFKLHENNRTCQDLDECEMFKEQRLCIGECVNIPGSFSCRCPPGYTLGPDGRSCQDVDECLKNPCRGEDELCLNTRGSYRCNSIKCPPSYTKDLEHKNRCKRIQKHCKENDTDCLQKPLTYSYNFITFVSKLPIPPTGHLDLFTMRGPLWSGTNSQFLLDLLSARAAEKVPAATMDSFRLRNSGWNQGVISLVKPIPGPQEIELQLTMKIYHNGVFVASGVAKLLIHVSEFEY